MGPYRHFSGEQRARVGAWQRAEFKAERLVRPTSCVACGAREGVIDCHNEDYDKPAEFVGLCVRCHLMLHCRFKNRPAPSSRKSRINTSARGLRACPSRVK